MTGSTLRTNEYPAILHGKSDTSNDSIAAMPDLPEVIPSQLFLTPIPNGVTRPKPVTTTRLIVLTPQSFFNFGTA